MPPSEPHQFSKLAGQLIGDLRRVPNDDPPRARRRPTRELAGLIEELLQKNQIGRSSPEQVIREHWAEIVGGANASYSHPARIERNRLIVLAAHAVVRNELFHHREQIVERIRKLPGCTGVKLLHLLAG
ncbi:MAG: DUF721 domain-containing protein [Opitutus sp.]